MLINVPARPLAGVEGPGAWGRWGLLGARRGSAAQAAALPPGCVLLGCTWAGGCSSHPHDRCGVDSCMDRDAQADTRRQKHQVETEAGKIQTKMLLEKEGG